MQVDYDPSTITYADLLTEFWAAHRPVRPAPRRQYASIIFYTDEAERRAAEESKRAIEASLGRVYTEIIPLDRFHLAEEYHQKYYEKHGMVGSSCGFGNRSAR